MRHRKVAWKYCQPGTKSVQEIQHINLGVISSFENFSSLRSLIVNFFPNSLHERETVLQLKNLFFVIPLRRYIKSFSCVATWLLWCKDAIISNSSLLRTSSNKSATKCYFLLWIMRLFLTFKEYLFMFHKHDSATFKLFNC